MRRILIVDDEYAIADLLSQILGAEGYHVDKAHDGSQALVKLATEMYELVLLDWMMPVLNGQETLRRIRAEFSGVRVIVMSAARNVDLREFQPVPFLAKPFSLAVLLQTVQGELTAAAL